MIINKELPIDGCLVLNFGCLITVSLARTGGYYFFL